jgi:hypothetical protein
VVAREMAGAAAEERAGEGWAAEERVGEGWAAEERAGEAEEAGGGGGGEGGGGALFASVHVIKPISANSESHSVEHWEAPTPAPLK